MSVSVACKLIAYNFLSNAISTLDIFRVAIIQSLKVSDGSLSSAGSKIDGFLGADEKKTIGFRVQTWK
jgi:hypothetical protein